MNTLSIEENEYTYQDYLDSIEQWKRQGPRRVVPEASESGFALQINLYVLPDRGRQEVEFRLAG